jgi:enoyl-CoA hydratase/carnithine racemase
MATFDCYKDQYQHIRLERTDGILTVTLHYQGGAPVWTSSDASGIHNELGWAFYQIGRDPHNEVVILTHVGEHFMEALYRNPQRPSAPSGGLTPAHFDRIYKEGKDLLANLLEIEVPVISAVRGKAFIHAELATMADIVLADSTAVFADKAHFVNGAMPGDGAHVWWTMLLGPNRGRYFLLTGQEIPAAEARTLGFVGEVLEPAALMQRAWTLATEIARQPRLVRRYSRVALTQHIKRRMLDDLGYGLSLEGLGVIGR